MLRKLIEILWPSPKRMHDAFFGELTFMTPPRGSSGYWEGGGTFEPTGEEIEYFIDGDENGPGESQRDAYIQIQAHYAELLQAIEPALRDAYSSWFPNAPTDEILSRFTLTSLSVPLAFSNAMEWDLSFDSLDDSEHLFTVTMRGLAPVGEVAIDG